VAVRPSSRVAIVDEHDTVADKNLVFYGDALADESVRRDLAQSTHDGVFLNLNERANLALVADAATVKIDEVINLHRSAELNVLRYTLKFGIIHSSPHFRLPRCENGLEAQIGPLVRPPSDPATRLTSFRDLR